MSEKMENRRTKSLLNLSEKERAMLRTGTHIEVHKEKTEQKEMEK